MEQIDTFKEPITRIHALESRARTVNLTIKEVCRRAGRRSSQIYRWLVHIKENKFNPQLGGFEETLAPLEAVLNNERARLFFSLAADYLPQRVIAAAAERAGFDLTSLDAQPGTALLEREGNSESPRSKRSVAEPDASLSSGSALAADAGEGAANV